MRLLLALICASALAQEHVQDLRLHSQSELVVTPAAITDRHGARVEGLTADDLILYDNNVPRAIHVDDEFMPISLVLVVQATATAHPILEKLRKEVSLLEPLIAGDLGDAALVAFASDVTVLNPFMVRALRRRDQEPPSNFDAIARSLRNLDVMGTGASVNDAMLRAVQLLDEQPPRRRRIILLIAEKHDRSSKSKVQDVLAEAQRANVTIYPVTFSPSLTPYTTRAPRFCDPPPSPRLDKDERKCKDCDRECGMCARQCFRTDDKQHELPPSMEQNGMNLLAVFVELKRLAQIDLAGLYAKSSGGMVTSFLRKEGLEKALENIGADLHSQYLLSFQPDANAAAGFHYIRVEVKDRPELVVRTRPGYWKAAN